MRQTYHSVCYRWLVGLLVEPPTVRIFCYRMVRIAFGFTELSLCWLTHNDPLYTDTQRTPLKATPVLPVCRRGLQSASRRW